MIRVLIADDHDLFVEGLSELLSQRPDLELVGKARDGLQAIEQTEKLTPDIILMDIAMPEVGGIKALHEIRKKFPEQKILMLSMHNNKELITESLKAGANGYVLKECTSDELYEAIKSVIHGQYYIARGSLEIVIADYLRLLEAEEKIGLRHCDPHHPDPAFSDRGVLCLEGLRR